MQPPRLEGTYHTPMNSDFNRNATKKTNEVREAGKLLVDLRQKYSLNSKLVAADALSVDEYIVKAKSTCWSLWGGKSPTCSGIICSSLYLREIQSIF